MILIKKFYPLIFIFLIWFGFSYPFFLKNKVPFSSSYQINFFPPWSSYQELAGPVKNNAQPDIITQIYPWRHFAIEEFKKGRIPLWNPYSFAGTPHLANYQSGVLFPLNLIFFIGFKFIDGWSLLVLLQPLMAGVFTYLFARSIEISKKGSLISAFSFMFCGFITTWMGYATLGFAILFLPLALFCIERYLDTKKKIFGFFLTVSIMLSLLSGHFQTSLYFLLATFSYLLFKIFFYQKKDYLLFAYYLFGILLAMPQLLPSVEFYANSVRSQLFQKVEAVPWSYLPTVISPDFYGNPVTRNDWFGHYAEWSSFSGTVAFSLALFTLFIKKSRLVKYFIGFFIVTFLLAYDTPLVNLLVMLKIPVLSTSSVSRILVLSSFSIAVLAGFGFDGLLKNVKKNKAIYYWIGSLVLIFSLILIFSFVVLKIDKRPVALKNSVLTLLSLVSLAAIALSLKFLNYKKTFFILPFVLVFLSGFEMLRFASKWQSFDDKNLVFKSVSTTERYEKGFSYDRVFGDFTAENSVYYRLQTLGGYDPLYPARYGKFVRYVGSGTIGEGERSVVNFPKKGEYVPQVLDLLGVKYISHKVSDGNFPWAFPFSDYPIEKFKPVYDDNHYRIFENNSSFKRAFILYSTQKAVGDREILDKLFSSDLSKEAIVESNINLNKNGKGHAEIVEYNPSNIKLKVSSNDKALLVLTDNFYPGWKVKINGVNQKVERVDFTFRGVVVPRGDSMVEFFYMPLSFSVGVYLSMIGLLGIVLVGIYNRIQKV